MPESPLISVAELHERLAQTPRPVLLDVRWALGDPHGREHYRSGHLPSALFVDLERDLSGPASAAGGRHPLPDLAALQRAARRWGIRDASTVVAYDDSGGLAAARAWWVLRWAGLIDVRILDGALAAWIAAGYPLETGEAAAQAGDVELRAGRLAVLEAEDAASLARRGLLLDARAAERYQGLLEPVDPRAGHIPGAISAPSTENLDDDGRFLDASRLRRRFERLGASDGAPIGVYCGSGVTAAHEIAALALAGFDAALYPGSWSQWSADPQRPAALGTAPG